MHSAPTIVAVEAPVDLALAWNLRRGGGFPETRCVLPVPIERFEDRSVLRCLADWIRRLNDARCASNFCNVVSLSVPPERLGRARAALAPELMRYGIEHVDVGSPFENLPAVWYYEREHYEFLDMADRTLTIPALRPQIADYMGANGSWIVELVDAESKRERRSVSDLYLPARPCVRDVLNVPEPPGIPVFGGVPKFGFGGGSLDVYFCRNDRPARLCLPTAEEVLLEILIEREVEAGVDEKSSAYRPAIEKFGGLSKAAHHFKGRLRQVIRVLSKADPKGLRLSAILAGAKLGDGRLPEELGMPGHLDKLLANCPPAARRVSRKRFTEHWRDYYPDDDSLRELLGDWKRRGLLSEVEGLYSLDPVFGRAVEEGIIPVVLTGNFLHRMTYDGFLWLPGLKYEREGRRGDIDILAACDGRLVFAECKSLERSTTRPDKWEKEVWPQFEELIDIGKICSADVVILASLADVYPEGWEDRAKARAGGNVDVLLLNREDLDKGARKIASGDGSSPTDLRIVHLTDKTSTEPIARVSPGDRQISTPFGRMGYLGYRP